MQPEAIVTVSGLPRSGTSMMMQALQAGGTPVLTDQRRPPDDDNPRGYLEFEPAKKIAHDQSWLPQAQGKAVKVVSALLRHLPPEYQYKIIFMRRPLNEVLASQQAMLRRRGAQGGPDDAAVAPILARHLTEVTAWIARQPNMSVLYIDYHDVLRAPAQELARVRGFLGSGLDLEAMVSVVDERLYRQRW
jgi:hypothetical protein